MTVDLATCLNCGATLTGHYCAQCGQKTEAVNPTFGEFAHELMHEISHVDSKMVRSAQMLLTRCLRLLADSRPEHQLYEVPRRDARGTRSDDARGDRPLDSPRDVRPRTPGAYATSWLRTIVGTVVVVATYWMLVLFAMIATALPVLYRTGG
jgi:hypothetical protein